MTSPVVAAPHSLHRPHLFPHRLRHHSSFLRAVQDRQAQRASFSLRCLFSTLCFILILLFQTSRQLCMQKCLLNNLFFVCSLLVLGRPLPLAGTAACHIGSPFVTAMQTSLTTPVRKGFLFLRHCTPKAQLLPDEQRYHQQKQLRQKTTMVS